MKAIVYERYGTAEVLELREVERPAPADGQILVRVRASSVNPYDWHLMTGLPLVGRMQFGLRKAKDDRLGADFAGVVEAVGRDVTEFSSGDEVFGMVDGGVPGQHLLDLGGLAEFVCVSEYAAALKPANLTFEEAAAVPAAGFTALAPFWGADGVVAGQRVLINGASGGVGPLAVQIAKAVGAEVHGVCSTRNVALVQSLGADRVFDYTTEDFTRSGEVYDIVLDNVGNHSLSACLRVVKPDGVYYASFGRPENRWLGPFAYIVQMGLRSRFVRQKLVVLSPDRAKEALLVLKDLLERGEVKPVIDRTYPLAETRQAMEYLGEGHARGKVVVTV